MPVSLGLYRAIASPAKAVKTINLNFQYSMRPERDFSDPFSDFSILAWIETVMQ